MKVRLPSVSISPMGTSWSSRRNSSPPRLSSPRCSVGPLSPVASSFQPHIDSGWHYLHSKLNRQVKAARRGAPALAQRSLARQNRDWGLLQRVQDQVPPQPRPILMDGKGVRRSPGGLRALVPREMIKAFDEGGYIANDTIRGHRALLGLAA